MEEILLYERESLEVTEAKLDGLENWKKNKLYTEVDNERQELISVRWVLTEKIQEGVLRVKYRMLARGFDDMERNFVRKDSQTCDRENHRLVLVLITLQSWKIHSMDIKSALLQRKPIEGEVLLKPPMEVSTNKVWKLNTIVYGLCDAPRVCYLSAKEELINTAGVKSRYDHAIFFWHNNQLLQCILLSHVDNFFGQELSGS